MPPPGKPLPLKQRTSSVDQRRDYNSQTWLSVMGLLKLREYVITVDHFSIWRRHLAWAVESGSDLRTYMTQRYASSMVFVSLLLATEINVLFNSAGVTSAMRQALHDEQYDTISFWAGFVVILSTIFSLLSLVSIFTAWTMVSAVSAENAHCIFRSSIGQYIAQMPGRFIVCSLYSFLLWISLFILLLLPLGLWSILLLFLMLGLFVHTITAFSAFGRVIMHTGAMGSTRIFDKTYESSLLPHMLHSHLLIKAKANLGNQTSIMRQYLSKRNKPITRMYSEDEMSGHLSDRSALSPGHLLSDPTHVAPRPPPPPAHVRRRTNSLVRFEDGLDTNCERVEMPSPKMTTPRNQEIQIHRDGKTSMSALTVDDSASSTPPPLPSNSRRPPRPLLTRRVSEPREEDHTTTTTMTPVINKNDSNNYREVHPLTGQHTEFAERWITSSNLLPLDDDDDDDDDDGNNLLEFERQQVAAGALPADDKAGNAVVLPVSSDNPYLLHEKNPSYFLPPQISKSRSTSVSSLDRSCDDDDEEQGGTQDQLTDDERFDQEYGDLFESEENFSGGSENIVVSAMEQELPGAPPPPQQQVWDYNERQSLLDGADSIERGGVYDSIRDYEKRRDGRSPPP